MAAGWIARQIRARAFSAKCAAVYRSHYHSRTASSSREGLLPGTANCINAGRLFNV